MYILNLCSIASYKLNSSGMNLCLMLSFVGCIDSTLFLYVLCNFGLQTHFEWKVFFVLFRFYSFYLYVFSLFPSLDLIFLFCKLRED